MIRTLMRFRIRASPRHFDIGVDGHIGSHGFLGRFSWREVFPHANYRHPITLSTRALWSQRLAAGYFAHRDSHAIDASPGRPTTRERRPADKCRLYSRDEAR